MFEWSDKLGPRERRAWLVLRKGDDLVAFSGESIPGLCVVVGTDYERAGKWSHTTYRLELAAGVVAIPGRDGWETGRFVEALGADTWVSIANALGVSLPSAQRFLRAWRPKAAEALDKIERELAELDESSSEGAEPLTLTFGSPTRRMRNDGFWTWPVTVMDGDRMIGSVSPHPERGWGEPVVHGDIRLLDCAQSRGYGGGSISLRVAAPSGARLVHGEESR